ncbi:MULTISPECIES: HPF/RaiA family ribosome-associated protein [Niastella]|uniref:HPF/RaiA family ribosome-associated protein n=1 Tax=Niastella soli TaxID=2821487 RepID=A0ABS3YUL7_9BACT|nr:HPF/RaiA family ribosome-associated protein [Niastella soli]MBO9201578.1 HPF/RaiA family ribosome-associated protein [Niastella soli]
MKLKFKSPDVRLDVGLDRLLHNRFARLEKVFNRIAGLEVFLRKIDSNKKDKYEMEGRVFIQNTSLFCRERGESIEDAINNVIENLARQLRWKKEERVEIW